MGRLTIQMSLTLDGIVQAPGQRTEDLDDDFRHGGWMTEYLSNEAGEAYTRQLRQFDALLLGRRTYEIFANFWPTARHPMADVLNSVPKYVVSTTLTETLWHNSHLITNQVGSEWVTAAAFDEDVAEQLPGDGAS